MISIVEDIRTIHRNDPPPRNIEFLLYSGFHAILIYRFTHLLCKLRILFIPRFSFQIRRFSTGIEINPGAKIEKGFFIDHGMGVVIGETSETGEKCELFPNVTLGGTGKHKGKRHPTVGNNVMNGTGAILLGLIKVGNNVRTGAKTFILMRDAPDNTIAADTPGRIGKMNGQRVNLELSPSKKDRRGNEKDGLFRLTTRKRFSII